MPGAMGPAGMMGAGPGGPGMAGAMGPGGARGVGPRAPGMAGAMGPGGPRGAGPTGPGMPGGFPGMGAGPNIGRGEGMPGAGPGAFGASGKAADYRNPTTAVTAFLDALKQRDADLLAESTALRAPTEAHANNRKLFTSILDHSISDDDFDDLIEKLDGYQIAFLNQPKSSGRQGVVLQKKADNTTYLRTIDVRREKAGWKVVDIGGVADLKTSVSGVRSKTRRSNR